MRKVKFFLTLVLLAITSGCISSDWEKPIIAEYDLSKDTDKQVIVFVEQPGWLNAEDNLQYYITRAFSYQLINNVGFEPKMIIPYAELSDYRSKLKDASMRSPLNIAKGMNADLAIFVKVDGYHLYDMDATGFYKGYLAAQVLLVDVETKEKLWPNNAKSKNLKVAVDIESRGRDAAVKRLTGALAHCSVRYLYDCLKKRFKISEDRTSLGWGDQ
ncbi:MAG: hypothetical protein KAS96_10885 [Planctomycetes bacterium]|nr:hypothetical protein [Planctomycetota bacterium]